MNSHIQPAPGDDLSAPMWTAMRERRLSLQRCSQCSYTRFPASELCPECWSRNAVWHDVKPTGTIWSYTVYERALHPELKDAVPYTVALIELAAGPVIPGRILCDEDSAPIIGDRVTGLFTDIDEEFTMLEWALHR